MTDDRRMFLNDAFSERDKCMVCRWQFSRMCPKSSDFVGRHMTDPSRVTGSICHRFVPTEEENDRRQEIVYDKLHENLEFDS